MLLLSLLLAVGPAAGAPLGPCRPATSRRLLQQGAAAGNSSSLGAGDSNATVIETVEVDVVSQECVMITNSYYEVLPSAGVQEVLSPWTNIQDSARDCCASCHDLMACNAFQWCPLEAGCETPPNANNASQLFPYRGCQLIDLSGFLRGSVNTGQLKQAGASVPFTAGSPLLFSVPKLSGYDVEIGRNFGGKFNYTCPGTLWDGGCVLTGDAQALKVACDDDPLCLAFSYYPSGSNFSAWRSDQPYGVLKGGEDVELSSADTELNPTAAIYIKLQPGVDDLAVGDVAAGTDGGDGDGDGGGSTTTVVAAVVGSVAGAAVLAASVLLVFYLRGRRGKAAVADGRKPGDGSGGGEVELDGELGSGGSADDSGGGSPLAPAPGDGTPSDVSEGSAGLDAAAAAALAAGKPLKRTFSPPSVVDASHPPSGVSGPPPAQFSPYMLLSSHAAVGGYNAAGEMVMLRASGTSSEGSAYAVTQDWAAGASPHQPSPPSPLQQQHAGGEGAAVEVQRTAPRGSLPPSSQLAGNARELLEVFARMYNQRPAVDYAVVAQMLDQEADPGEVEEAEEADEEALRQVDELGAQHRSAPPSDASGDAYSAVWQQQQRQQQGAYAALWQQQQQQQQGPYGQVSPQQYLDVEVAVVENVQQQAAAAPRSEPGSAQQSLLPGMLSPPATSLLPPPAVWSLQPEEVEICKRPDGSYWQLGTGAFGTCYKGLYHGRQLVAVKVLHRVEERRRGEEFEREVALLKDLRDRNIVQFIGACLDGPTPMLVTEFMEFGDLWRALPLKNPQGHRIFAWHKRGRRVLYDVAKGLFYLHRRRIVHLDLKSANILLSRHGTAKICDIGMARVLGNKEYLSMLSGMGTFAWSAPEVLSGKRCTEKVDLYSFGVVIWEVCTGDVPVRGEMRPLAAPADCPQPVVDLYERCIAELPEQRPTAAELLEVLGALL